MADQHVQEEQNVLLRVAAANGNCERMQAALERGANINSGDAFNSTALHFSVAYGHRDATALLVTSGADISAKNEQGKTPQDFCPAGTHRNVLTEMLQSGPFTKAAGDTESSERQSDNEFSLSSP
eukprot:CAMPEP_0175826064 /NCGR_PEP_ID=MMETSP0107_2-20121207/11574_1 /TAXON_ID=195067 ORGANISM="Goniomonas pacifica, Strain CCMP1869" /NCGR_SAMPLE_ID=MMETSP0107_2 /ASSEMBLY_ACC=CAM_ASM_000203 /LENGTH=124 /DNA_ID=CAMNT_0017138695 /DNA_START=59 /DNA_END=431 /DNA_ORIENTATION=-